MKILFVLRDIMPARMAVPIMFELQQNGCITTAIVEGKAKTICQVAGINRFLASGSDALTPFKEAEGELAKFRPDIICIGCSYPINWELEFAQAARELRIPVVALEDIWGALSRLQDFVPDLALVMDDFAAQTATENGRAKKCTVVGDIVSTINAKIPEDLKVRTEELTVAAAEKILILVIGEWLENLPELMGAVTDCIHQESGSERFIVVPRLVHPKLANDPKVTPMLAEVDQLLGRLRVNRFENIGTDALGAKCHYTMTGFSTGLRIALHHGRRAVSVMTPKSRSAMTTETGFTTYPLAASGVIPSIDQATRLSDLDWPGYELAGRLWSERSKFRPQVGAEAILDLTQTK